jgi:hypothetical protein
VLHYYKYSADPLSLFNIVRRNLAKAPSRDRPLHYNNYYNTLVANFYLYNNPVTGRVLSVRTDMRQWR